jgi:ribosomal-protein-alanine N-acetyltransferase
MLLADLATVLAIENTAHASPWSESIFVDCIESQSKGYRCEVLSSGSSLVGYAILSAAIGEAHLHNIAVATSNQGLGLGRHLLNWVIDWGVEQNAQTLFLEVRASNTAALRLYRSSGFQIIGVRSNYYPGVFGREDAIVMGFDLFQGRVDI